MVVTLALLLLIGCGQQHAGQTLPALSKLETLVVRAEADGGGRSWDGVVEAVRQATLTAQTSGRVTAVDADVNDRVPAGAVLLRLTAVEQQAGANTARAQLRAAEAVAIEAEHNYRRYAALAKSQYVSRAQIDQARAARDSAIAARDAARAQLAQAGQQADYTIVRAPYAGVISARAVEPGEAVEPGQSLMTVYAPGVLRIEVDVPQSEVEAIRQVKRADVLLNDGRRIAARDVIVYPSADPMSHSVTVRVLLPEITQPPSPGATAKVVFSIRDANAIPHIPASMLVQRGEISAVYVLSDGRLSLRQLRIGQRIGNDIEVLSGLKAGEKIATDPVAAVQALAAQRRAAGAARG